MIVADDLFTTGATVDVCARALLEMGAASAFGAFSACCLIAFLFAIYRIRETAGLSLEEIEKDAV